MGSPRKGRCSPIFVSIPNVIKKEVEKACHGIYPLQDVYVRKVKILKKPKFDSKFGGLTRALYLLMLYGNQSLSCWSCTPTRARIRARRSRAKSALARPCRLTDVVPVLTMIKPQLP